MMPVRYSELKKLLRDAGCRVIREGANHELWFSPITGRTFPVGRHDSQEIPTGTLRSIKKDAGL